MDLSKLSKIGDSAQKPTTGNRKPKTNSKSILNKILGDSTTPLRITDSLARELQTSSRKSRREFLSQVSVKDRRELLTRMKRIKDSESVSQAKLNLINVKNLVDNFQITGRGGDEISAYVKSVTLPEALEESVSLLLLEEEIPEDIQKSVVELYEKSAIEPPIFVAEKLEDSLIDKITETDFEDPDSGEIVSQSEEESLLQQFAGALTSFATTGETSDLEEVWESIEVTEENQEDETTEEAEDTPDPEFQEAEDEFEEHIEDAVKIAAGYWTGKKYKYSRFRKACDSLNLRMNLPLAYFKGTKLKVVDSVSVSEFPNPSLSHAEYHAIKDNKLPVLINFIKRVSDQIYPASHNVAIVDNMVEVLLPEGGIQYWQPSTDVEELAALLAEASGPQVSQVVTENAVPLQEIQATAAALNELDLVDSSFYKKDLSSNDWYADEVPQILEAMQIQPPLKVVFKEDGNAQIYGTSYQVESV